MNTVFTNSAQQYVPTLKVITASVPGTGTIAPDLRRSDHAMFWDGGIEALMLTDGANFRNANYHTPNDVKDSLDFAFMTNVVKASVATLATLAKPRHSSMAVTAISNLTSIEEKRMNCDMSIHPEGRNGINLNFEGCSPRQISIELIDQKGQLIMKQNNLTWEQQMHIELRDTLAQGVYFVNIINERGQWGTGRFIVR